MRQLLVTTIEVVAISHLHIPQIMKVTAGSELALAEAEYSITRETMHRGQVMITIARGQAVETISTTTTSRSAKRKALTTSQHQMHHSPKQ